MNTVSNQIEKDNNIPNFFDEKILNNLSYDYTELIENFYKNLLDVFFDCNRDSLLGNENEKINPQMNIEGKKTKDKSTDIESNHIEKKKKEKQLLGRKHLKNNSKNYSKNSKSHKNETNDEKKSIKKKR